MTPMTDDDLDDRTASLIRCEVDRCQFGWWYLSFVGNSGFLGGVLVEAFGIIDAIRQSHLKGINPGGAVAGLPWPENIPLPPPSFRHRLLAAEEVRALSAP